MAVNKFCKSCRSSTCRRSPNSLSLSLSFPIFSLYSLRTHPTISLLSSISDNFFFGTILSSTMHIYILANARNERQTEQIGFRQWHGRRWRGGSCKRGPRVCHRRQETLVPVNNPIKMDRKRTPGTYPVGMFNATTATIAIAIVITTTTITIVATILHYCRNCTTVSEWCNSQPIRRAQTAAVHQYLVYAALIDI